MRLLQIAARVAGEKPLSDEEKKELARANIFVMDYEMDGGSLPPDIEALSTKEALTPSEERKIIAWAKRLAPGNFWD